MNRSSLIRRCTAVLLTALLVIPFGMAPAMAQDQGAPPAAQPPAMQTVFLNTVYGSAVGALLGLAVAIESSSDKTQPANTHENAFTGATIGGLVGLVTGVVLVVFTGTTFDPSAVFVRADPSPGRAPVAYQPKDLAPAPGEAQVVFLAPPTPSLAPFALETAPGEPGHITGFRARVMDFHF